MQTLSEVVYHNVCNKYTSQDLKSCELLENDCTSLLPSSALSLIGRILSLKTTNSRYMRTKSLKLFTFMLISSKPRPHHIYKASSNVLFPSLLHTSCPCCLPFDYLFTSDAPVLYASHPWRLRNNADSLTNSRSTTRTVTPPARTAPPLHITRERERTIYCLT